MRRLQEILKKNAKSRILDVATGSGQFIQILTSLSDDYEAIIGLDPHKLAIERARKSFADEGVEFVLGDIYDDLEIGLFDIITISNSMHHFKDMSLLMSTIKKYLKPDGYIIINEMIRDNQNDKQMTHVKMHHFWAEIDRMNGVIHKETFTNKSLVTFFENTQYKLVDSWSMDFGEEQVLTDEDYTYLKNTLTKSLERVKDNEQYASLVEQSDLLKARLDDIGFQSATSKIFILRNC